VAKAYTTRVGEGPFPTEFSPSFSQFIRNKGKEFGATTGRPRRCGWFDSVLVKEAVLINGISELAIMKMDILDGLESIKICTGYKYKGKKFQGFPYDLEVLKNATCVYRQFPGWSTPVNKIRRYKDFPKNAKNYLKNIQDMLGVKISLVSVGSSREETIFLD
jgi:adenylosuccinate synthase